VYYLIQILLIHDRDLNLGFRPDNQGKVFWLSDLLVEGLDHVVAGLRETEPLDPQHGLGLSSGYGLDLKVLIRDGIDFSAWRIVPKIKGKFLCFCLKRERETERQRDRETERQRDWETERLRDREAERQRDRETERQTERQRDRAI
jgi:hypothetical protein